DVLVTEKIVLDGSVEKGKQLEFVVSFRLEIYKVLLKRMQALESRTSDLPDNIIYFTEERVDGNVTSYVRIISTK
ncbi:hypothetical protein KI387_026709, partial [Taxus chinensis]